jgi:hypothetical protein
MRICRDIRAVPDVARNETWIRQVEYKTHLIICYPPIYDPARFRDPLNVLWCGGLK